MTPIYERPDTRLYCADCRHILPTIDAETIDACITDPPAGIGFMGKEWDDFRRSRNEADVSRENQFGRLSTKGPQYARRSRAAFMDFLTDVMSEVFRLLKPGAHALVWAIPRTSHWTATAIENAGFEIRDVIMHIFGEGFPKSLDVSKAIDKAAGATREVIGQRIYADGSAGKCGAPSNKYAQDDWTNADDRPERLKLDTAPATPEAARWQGYGTALKPAAEHWILARKPTAGTVAKTVQQYGTGALNIDGCRIATESTIEMPADGPPPMTLGRWPANVTHDGSAEVTALFPDSVSSGGFPLMRKADPTRNTYGGFNGNDYCQARRLDAGSTARFFYCAKADREDRNAGCEIIEPRALLWSSEDKSPGTFQAQGTDKSARNFHPTVKPTELMRWLCRLITPPAGLILDPFAGSGSTGKAAALERFRFLGIEQNADYCAIAAARIKHAHAAELQPELFPRDTAPLAAPEPLDRQLDLFGGPPNGQDHESREG